MTKAATSPSTGPAHKAMPSWLERRLPHLAIDAEATRPPAPPLRPAFEEA
jgi:hypothetical protein